MSSCRTCDTWHHTGTDCWRCKEMADRLDPATLDYIKDVIQTAIERELHEHTNTYRHESEGSY